MTDEADRPYAGQEGDINEKLLLDLAWERQQKKVRMAVRARWRVGVACCNLYLSCRWLRISLEQLCSPWGASAGVQKKAFHVFPSPLAICASSRAAVRRCVDRRRKKAKFIGRGSGRGCLQIT